MNIFKKLFQGLKKTKDAIVSGISNIFGKGELDDDFYDGLEEILITADVGYAAAEKIIERLKQESRKEKIKSAEECTEKLRKIIAEMLEEGSSDSASEKDEAFPKIIMCVGVNGTGKTTTVGRLANYYKQNKKEVIIAAADTFRAAATEQLMEWSERAKVRIIKQGEGADSASVVFDAIKSARAKNADVLIIDTAGRLHNNINLMAELNKIGKITSREWSEAFVETYIVLDATTGQNAISQAELFNKSVPLSGIILTKLDGTAKGGVVIQIKEKLNIPIKFIGIGEGINDIEEFNAKNFAEGIL